MLLAARDSMVRSDVRLAGFDAPGEGQAVRRGLGIDSEDGEGGRLSDGRRGGAGGGGALAAGREQQGAGGDKGRG